MSLDKAQSPYLLSHKDNPVKWRTWDAGVVADARAQDKPILLSLGYGGCHWCHVMNRESFSDPEVAALIHESFIPVLVDREERPDLDLIYQGAAGLMGHSGGWPLNIFLTPDGVPFWVAGYQPLVDRPDQTSFRRVVTETAQLWKENRAQADDTAGKVRAAIENLYNRDMGQAQENMNLDLAAIRIGQRFDVFFGGQQGPMKFPNPMLMDVLWRAFLRTGNNQFSQLVFTSLDGILFGGIYDHIGGGFFRHSLDENWLQPAFEKTLYDQALLLELCTQAWQFNRNELCRQRVAETMDLLLREMRSGDAFAASVASGNQAEDGRFYLWSEAEIDAALVGTFSARFKQVYGISRDGNMDGKNLPRRLGNPLPANEADEALLAKQREMLRAARDKRSKPHVDTRLITDWNGLMIASLARAGMVFERPDWVGTAIAAFHHVMTVQGDGDRLAHIATNGVKGGPGFADDYANMARAALQLWEVTGDAAYLDRAKAWTGTLDSHFWNNQINGYCFYSDDAAPLFIRPRMLFDNPAPSANGTMLTVLTRLALITGERPYMQRAQSLAVTFGAEANRMLHGSGSFLTGFEYLINALMIVIVGHKGHARTKDLVRAYWSKPIPNGLLVQIEPGEDLPEDHPARGRGMEGGVPTAYIVQAGRCSDGITGGQLLAQALTLPPQLRQQQPQQRTA
jgi:uncharacterized protein YyaL (SSP411 family)